MILFFIRRYNDIDHLAPVIYKIAKGKNFKIEILCLNLKINVIKDYRLSFLEKRFGVKTKYLFNEINPTVFHFILTGIRSLLLFLRNRINLSSKIMNYFLKLFYNQKILKTFYENSWANSFLRKKNPKVLIFDWQKPKSYIKPIIHQAQKMNIPQLVLPHGINLATNDLITNKALKDGVDENYGQNWKYFNFAVTQFKIHKERIVKGGYSPQKIKTLGSARFCSEWRSIMTKIIPKSKNLVSSSNGKLKVLIMDHSFKYRYKVNNVIDTIRNLVNLDFIDLIIKPSTAGLNSIKTESQGSISSLELYNIARVEPEEESIFLIDWADVVLCTISSIGIEVLLKNKILIHPQYFHENSLLYDEMNACWTINNFEELREALNKINKTPEYRPYTMENVNKFIDYVIYGGEPKRDVLEGYKNFILSKI